VGTTWREHRQWDHRTHIWNDIRDVHPLPVMELRYFGFLNPRSTRTAVSAKSGCMPNRKILKEFEQYSTAILPCARQCEVQVAVDRHKTPVQTIANKFRVGVARDPDMHIRDGRLEVTQERIPRSADRKFCTEDRPKIQDAVHGLRTTLLCQAENCV